MSPLEKDRPDYKVTKEKRRQAINKSLGTGWILVSREEPGMREYANK